METEPKQVTSIVTSFEGLFSKKERQGTYRTGDDCLRRRCNVIRTNHHLETVLTALSIR